MTRAEMLQRMSASEFYEWEILEKIEPFGEMAAWLRSALTACILANAHRASNTKAFTIDDFMPVIEEPAAQSPEQMLAFMMMLKTEQDAILALQK